MTIIHHVAATVVLTDSNRAGDRTFNLPCGVEGNGNLLTTTAELEPGTVVADLVSTPGGFNQTVKLFRVEADGVNELDEQPVKGDLIVTDGPAPVMQAGQVSIVTDGDGHIVAVGIGMLLAMVPLLVDVWMDENLGPRIEEYILGDGQDDQAEPSGGPVETPTEGGTEPAVTDTAEVDPADVDEAIAATADAEIISTPEATDGEPVETVPSGDGEPLPPASDVEQESPGVDVGVPIEATADGTESALPDPEATGEATPTE